MYMSICFWVPRFETIHMIRPTIYDRKIKLTLCKVRMLPFLVLEFFYMQSIGIKLITRN